MKKSCIIAMICLITGLVHAGYAADVTFTAEVDKTQLSVDDSLVLSFVISGAADMNNLSPQMPDLKQDFDIVQGPVQSSNISIVNGKYSSSISIQYALIPKKAGKLTIGAATVTVDNNTYTTEPITVEVVQGNAPQPQSVGQAGEQPQSDVFLRADIDKQQAYPGEQITLSYSLYTRVNIAGFNVVQQPNFTGFWVENLPTPDPPTLEYQMLNGVKYGVALMKKVALFPTKSGEVTIDPMVMSLGVRMRSQSDNPFDQFFNDPFSSRTKEVVCKTKPITLNILSLPEDGKPANFTGEVGQFTLSVALDKREVKQEDPLTLTVKIEGVGNIKTVKEPAIPLPEPFKKYDPKITENTALVQEKLRGEKTFESVVIPSAAGTYRIDPVQFTYFDSEKKAYQTLKSEPMEVVIQPKAQAEEPMERRIATKEEIKLIGKDIRFIKTDIAELANQGVYWYQQRWFALLHLLPIFAVAAALSGKWYHAKYASDARYMRQKRAKKLSQARLKSAQTFMDRGESKEFYAAISTALCQYLGDKFDLPPAGIVAADIARDLKAYGLNADTAEMLRQCLSECDFARFAPVGGNAEEMRVMLHKAEQIIEQIEQLKIRNNGANAAKKALLLFVILLACLLSEITAFAQPSVQELFQQGNKAYEAGNYREAIERYQAMIESGLHNGFVYYNLGNALLKEKRVGEAILAYERAKRLLPRDEDVAFNLEYANALTLDKMTQADDGKIVAILVSIRDFFTPDELSVALIVLETALAIAVIAWLFSSPRLRIRMLYAAIVLAALLFLLGVIFFSHIRSANSIDEAIMLIPQTEARTGPGDEYSPVFTIHEGAKVRIQREKSEWVEVKLPNKVIGWVMQKDLARIK